MIYPKRINNKFIGVCAPSSGITDKKGKEYCKLASKKMKKRGYNILFSNSCFENKNGRSNDSKIRAKELIDMYTNDSINIIFSLSGGDYEMEILDYLSFTKIKRNPKYFVGHSDNSILTFLLTTRLEIASIYGYNYYELAHEHNTIDKFLSFIEGKNVKLEEIKKCSLKDYDFFSEKTNLNYKLDMEKEWIIKGSRDIDTSGIMIGGLLDDLIAICGTKYDNVKAFLKKYQEFGFVWYFDICMLDPESVKRAFFQLKNAGWFKYSKLIMVSRPINQDDSYGISYIENIYDELLSLNIPIIFNADFGHIPPRIFAVNGALARIKSNEDGGTIEYKEI